MPKNKNSAANKAKHNARAAAHQYKKTVAAYAKRDAQEVADMMEAEIGWTLANGYFGVQQLPKLDSSSHHDDDADDSFVVGEHHHDYAAFPPGLSLETYLAFSQSQRHGTKRPASDGHEWRPVPPREEQPSQRPASSAGGSVDQRETSIMTRNLAAANVPATMQDESSTTNVGGALQPTM
jgi:hypothetical protein